MTPASSPPRNSWIHGVATAVLFLFLAALVVHQLIIKDRTFAHAERLKTEIGALAVPAERKPESGDEQSVRLSPQLGK